MIESLLFAGVFALGTVACRAALRLVTKLAILDHPNERSSHVRPTPRGGGMGIVAALVPGAAVGALLLPPGPAPAEIAVLGGAVVALAVLGGVDDRRGVRPAAKLLVQAAAAAAVVLAVGGVRRVALPGVGEVSLGAAGPVLTVAWLVAFSNGFNFMDGIDGIASGSSVATHGSLALVFFLGGEPGFASLAAVNTAASVGFLFFNYPPATVFMGDGGAIFLGMTAGALSLAAVQHRLLSFPAAILLMLPFLFDATGV